MIASFASGYVILFSHGRARRIKTSEEKDMDLGKNIARLRKENKMTQEDLASQIGVSAQALSKWENGNNMPDIMMLPTLARIFGVKVDDLFSGDCSSSSEVDFDNVPAHVYDIAYDAVFGAFKRFEKGVESWDENRYQKLYRDCKTNDEYHSGIVAYERNGNRKVASGSVYIDSSVVLAFTKSAAEAAKLLKSEEAAKTLAALAIPSVRDVLAYMIDQPEMTFKLIVKKTGLSEDDIKAALTKLQELFLVSVRSVDLGEDEPTAVYSLLHPYSFMLLVYPILHMAQNIGNIHVSWTGLRG